MKIKNKQRFSVVLGLGMALALSVNFPVVNANADVETPYYINEKDVQMTQIEYNKLLQVGYTEREIETIDMQTLDEVNDMDIVRTTLEEYYVKTTTTERFDGAVISTDEVLEKEEILQEIESINKNEEMDDSEPENNNPSWSVYGRPDFSYTQPDIEGGNVYPSDSATITTEYKYMTVTGTYYYNQGNLGTFFVKVNLEWLKEPKNRFEDVITINTGSNLQIKSEHIGLEPYPAFDFKLGYKVDGFCKHLYRTEEYTVTEDYIENLEIVYDGDDTTQYVYSEGAGLAVKCNLPEAGIMDELVEVIEDEYDIYYEYEYKDFYLTLSANFLPIMEGMNTTSFIGTYQHGIKSVSLNMQGVELSFTAPYINFPVSISIEEDFDCTLERSIFFEDLLDY